MDGNVYINDAMVTVKDLEADNGVVHVIDAVILPQSTGIREFTSSTLNVNIYPNPAREYVNVSYELTNDSNIRLEMYDMMGQQLKVRDLGYAYEGSHTVEFPVNDMESGIYLLIIYTGNSQIANKVRVVK
ncbi:MAG TPA: T9SS type A sorting domain-containing protein [Bacteroidales bacterium]|nr:T9SS type A sorting domain-containing protein [Bacteroidales bacterium]